MKLTATQLIQRLHPNNLSLTLEVFLKDESIGGKLILAAALLSLAVVNSPLGTAYASFWHQSLSLGLPGLSISMDLRHWVNEALMAIFFLVVGLEIKRELVNGDLRDRKTALLPIGAAVGGMIIPAVVYLIFNVRTDAINGWGIPIATDIAFAVAVITLLGKRIPPALKVFLLTLAIADDIGAITVIALFYAEIIHYGYLAVSVFIIIALYFMRRRFNTHIPFIVLLAVILWITTHLSGIHASIVGAILGLLAPVGHGRSGVSLAESAEKFFLPISTFLVAPLFAFANAGFTLSASALSSSPSVLWGVAAGLLLGKVAGVGLAGWAMVKLRLASLPVGVTMGHIIGVGFLAGIGFTVSIFISELAFADNQRVIDAAKAGIFIGSFMSAIIGSLYLSHISRTATENQVARPNKT